MILTDIFMLFYLHFFEITYISAFLGETNRFFISFSTFFLILSNSPKQIYTDYKFCIYRMKRVSQNKQTSKGAAGRGQSR